MKKARREEGQASILLMKNRVADRSQMGMRTRTGVELSGIQAMSTITDSRTVV